MTESRYNKLITKIIWMGIPMVIGFLSWLTIMSFETRTSLGDIKARSEERGKLEEKMWQKVEENNIILQTKAGEKENSAQHQSIMTEIYNLKVEINNRLGLGIPIDKPMNMILQDTNYRLSTIRGVSAAPVTY